MISTSKAATERSMPPLIFVVDDTPELTEMAEIVLSNAGYRCKIFSDPQEVVKTILSGGESPDLLLTDYDMGAMNGLELVEECRRTLPDLKVLLLSGTIEAAIILKHSVKVNQFLGKPYQPAQLVALVKSILDVPPV